MNAEQKQRAVDLIDVTKTYRLDAEECAMQMAALLQELVDAPEPEPFGYFKAEPFGWTDCAETDDGAIALYTAPPAPSVPDGLQTIPSHDQLTQILNGLDRCGVAESKRAFLRTWIRDWTAHKLSAAPTPSELLTTTNPAQISSSPAEAPADVARWIDPNDKTQKQYLPFVGERVLFCHDGKTYYGKHTGGSFVSFTHPGNTYPTWECHWMYPPKAIDAMSEKGGAK